MYSSLFRQSKEAMTAVLILSSDSNHLPRSCAFTFSNNHLLHGVRSGELGGCSNTSQSQRYTRFSTSQWLWGVAWSWSKMTVVVVWVKIWPHLILQECAVILAIDSCTNWHTVVNYKSILAEEHDVHDFQNTLTVLCNFLPQCLDMPFSILSFHQRVKWMQPWLLSH